LTLLVGLSPNVPTPGVIASYAPDPRPYRQGEAPDWLGELDLSVTGAHVRMGTRALADDEWLLGDQLAREEIALRRRLLAEQRDLVYACTPFAAGPAAEAADLVDRWLVHHGISDLPAPEEYAPLARVGTLVQEDLCLMVRHDDAWHLEGAVLCFPSLWVLAEKLGRPAALVHEPVPYYAEELSHRVDTFLDRLATGKPVWRRNFSLWPALLLWAPCHTLDPVLHEERDPGESAPHVWLRSERQTLRRLPETGAVLFTIRVQCIPVSVLVHRPDRARDLVAWLRSPAGEIRCRQMGAQSDDLLAWLDQIAGTAER
jgi:dimethylamine monooxygenase subunit A